MIVMQCNLDGLFDDFDDSSIEDSYTDDGDEDPTGPDLYDPREHISLAFTSPATSPATSLGASPATHLLHP
jgi:hypothetical protein